MATTHRGPRCRICRCCAHRKKRTAVSSSTPTFAPPVGLTLRVFAIALIAFAIPDGQSTSSVDFHQLLKGAHSPGVIFRLDEHQLRAFIENVAQGPLRGALRFIDTSDTQSIVLEREHVAPSYLQTAQEEAPIHA